MTDIIIINENSCLSTMTSRGFLPFLIDGKSYVPPDGKKYFTFDEFLTIINPMMTLIGLEAYRKGSLQWAPLSYDQETDKDPITVMMDHTLNRNFTILLKEIFYPKSKREEKYIQIFRKDEEISNIFIPTEFIKLTDEFILVEYVHKTYKPKFVCLRFDEKDEFGRIFSYWSFHDKII